MHQLLKRFGFVTPLGHLDQAIKAHTRGDWAACNGQLRTFIESLFDDIARNVRPAESATRSSSENRRALLAEIGFLATDRNEWTQDGKNYINGLFKMLHTEGSHPGLSDEEYLPAPRRPGDSQDVFAAPRERPVKSLWRSSLKISWRPSRAQPPQILR
ncbi:hypothetical protein [Sinorhizobium terangae]|uniref:hypothetical protein n=1 Tax=Sinorhizobium terangae TaxID=110322 RepID=UPI001F2C083A|nr:hypothetical protein [Sinorhizobium terangae]